MYESSVFVLKSSIVLAFSGQTIGCVLVSARTIAQPAAGELTVGENLCRFFSIGHQNFALCKSVGKAVFWFVPMFLP